MLIVVKKFQNLKDNYNNQRQQIDWLKNKKKQKFVQKLEEVQNWFEYNNFIT